VLIKLSDLWFRHQSANFYKTLKPIPYKAVQAQAERSDEYMDEWKGVEQVYRNLLQSQLDIDYPENQSFLYATIVGYHKMEKPADYPGYTFYFKLTPAQLKQTIFEVVDKTHTLPAATGKEGLQSAMNFWKKFSTGMEEYDDPVVNGIIYPRVEVVLSTAVKPLKYVTQIEDRN
jgi:hypothetical protein